MMSVHSLLEGTKRFETRTKVLDGFGNVMCDVEEIGDTLLGVQLQHLGLELHRQAWERGELLEREFGGEH